MKRMQTILLALIFLLSLPLSQVFGGSSQANGERYFEPEQITTFAKKVEKTMANKGARVAIVARVGRDRSELPEGVTATSV